MTAYWISTYFEIRDPAKMAAYAELSPAAITAGGGRFLSRSKAEAAFEEGRLERSVLIEFDSVEAAVSCHDSELYQQALAALGDGALRDIRIVPGV
ncbi:DUF1330 domain-containing protein [Calidifontibacter terrae]